MWRSLSQHDRELISVYFKLFKISDVCSMNQSERTKNRTENEFVAWRKINRRNVRAKIYPHPAQLAICNSVVIKISNNLSLRRQFQSNKSFFRPINIPVIYVVTECVFFLSVYCIIIFSKGNLALQKKEKKIDRLYGDARFNGAAVLKTHNSFI